MGVRKQVAKLLAKLPKSDRRRADQAAALCWRVSDHKLEVLLITSKDTGRWIIPKGNIARRETSYRAAQREAFEESGMSGKIRKTAIGHYRYLKDGETLLVVAVHLLKANVEANTFPEQGERCRVWVAPSAAAAMVDEPELKEMLTKIDCRTVLASQDRPSKQARKSRDIHLELGTPIAEGLLPV